MRYTGTHALSRTSPRTTCVVELALNDDAEASHLEKHVRAMLSVDVDSLRIRDYAQF